MVDAVQRTEDFTATFDDGTRADLDGTAVVWNADDHLTIFTKTSHNRQYRVKDLSTNGRSATFEYVGYTGSDKTAISNNYAVYPYDAEATILGDVITTTLASEQTYNAECDLTYALMSAKSATNNFSFVNSGALLRFNISTILPDTFDLNYIQVSSQSHNIAGEVTIDTNDHLAVVTNNGTNEIKLTNIDATIDSDVKSFYIAMPAISFEKSDLSVTFSFADGDKTFALPAFDLEQGKIKSIDYSIKDAEEFTGSTPGENEPTTAKPTNNEIWLTLEPSILVDYTEIASTWLHNLCENYEIDIETGECILTFDRDVDYLPVFGYIWYDICDFLGYDFVPCPVISITLPECVTTIDDGALTNCVLLPEINIPDSVTTIGKLAFASCSSLTRFNGKYASDDGRCLIIDGTLNSFAPAGLTEYTIPNSVTEIGGYAFSDCSSLTSVTIPDSVTEIGNYAFYECSSLTSVTIPDIVTTIGGYAFAWCKSLTSVTIGDSVTTIGDDTFWNCRSLTSITIPDSVTSIGQSAFNGCSSLISINIPDSVTTIGNFAFDGCSSLTSVYCKAVTPPAGGINMFYSIASSGKIYVPTESVEAYKNADGWSVYAEDIVGYDF